jgi:hypothetical protein
MMFPVLRRAMALALAAALLSLPSAAAETRILQMTPQDWEEISRLLNSPEFQLRLYQEKAEALERENEQLRLRLEVMKARHPLAKVREGMPQRRVERILGKPARVEAGEKAMARGGTVPTRVATYYVRLPGQDGQHLITVVYLQSKPGWVFSDWEGPHVPD